MKMFLVAGGLATINGEALLLTKEQYAARAHNVEVVKDNGESLIVQPKVPLQFKVGEKIGLEAMPKHLASVLEPLDRPRDEERKAKR